MTLTAAITSYDLWTIAIAAACAVACAVPGCFLVLRRMSLLGDAISHSVLPGIALAFIATNSRAPLPMFIGAAGFALLAASLTSDLRRVGKVQEDAALGIVFTSLFAAGVLLLAVLPSGVDLDPSCVLYGVLEGAAYDTTWGVPRALLVLAPVALLNLTLVTIFYKELRLVCFDAALATAMGFSAGLLNYAIMLVVAATTVASFEAVGSVLVVAMLIAPPATARLLTDRLGLMIVLSALIALACAVLGYTLALLLDSTVSGMMASLALAFFGLAVAAAPREGLVARSLRRRALSARIAREDVLALLYRAAEKNDPLLLHPPQEPRSPRFLRAARSLFRRGAIRASQDGRLHLTAQGEALARELIASHRLWESYLARNLPLPLDHLHEPSERAEHFISPSVRERLGRESNDREDPHGRSIPS